MAENLFGGGNGEWVPVCEVEIQWGWFAARSVCVFLMFLLVHSQVDIVGKHILPFVFSMAEAVIH